jgi:hypothetical protein
VNVIRITLVITLVENVIKVLDKMHAMSWGKDHAPRVCVCIKILTVSKRYTHEAFGTTSRPTFRGAHTVTCTTCLLIDFTLLYL